MTLRADRMGYWRRLLGSSLLGLIATAACSNRCLAEAAPQSEQSARSARAHGSAPGAQEDSRVELERLKQPAARKKGKGKSKGGNAFGATSWYVPPPPPKPLPPPPPPPPSAPPMPFRYLGLYEGGAGQVIMLVRGDHIYTVGVGDVIDNTYRVDRFDNGTVEMTYLPLNIKQSISTGNPS